MVVDVQRLGPGHRRRHHRGPGRRAVRALGHCGRLPDHRPGAVLGARVLPPDDAGLRPGRALPLPGVPAHRQGTQHDHGHGGGRRLRARPRSGRGPGAAGAGPALPLHPGGRGAAAARSTAAGRRCASPGRPTTSAPSSPRARPRSGPSTEHLRGQDRRAPRRDRAGRRRSGPPARRRWSSPTVSPPAAMREAVRAGPRRTGMPVSSLVLQSLWPVPEKALRAAAAGVARGSWSRSSTWASTGCEVERPCPASRCGASTGSTAR